VGAVPRDAPALGECVGPDLNLVETFRAVASLRSAIPGLRLVWFKSVPTPSLAREGLLAHCVGPDLNLVETFRFAPLHDDVRSRLRRLLTEGRRSCSFTPFTSRAATSRDRDRQANRSLQSLRFARDNVRRPQAAFSPADPDGTAPSLSNLRRKECCVGAVPRDAPALGECVGPDLNRRTPTGQRPQRCAVGLAWLPTHGGSVHSGLFRGGIKALSFVGGPGNA